jgi:hypothetical protein
MPVAVLRAVTLKFILQEDFSCSAIAGLRLSSDRSVEETKKTERRKICLTQENVL